MTPVWRVTARSEFSGIVCSVSAEVSASGHVEACRVGYDRLAALWPEGWRPPSRLTAELIEGDPGESSADFVPEITRYCLGAGRPGLRASGGGAGACPVCNKGFERLLVDGIVPEHRRSAS